MISNIELEHIMLCDSIAATIFENYEIYNGYYCMHCQTMVHGRHEEGEIIEIIRQNVIQHVRDHYYEEGFNGLGGLYICGICNTEFYST